MIMNKILFYKISFYKILEILEIGFFTSQRLFEVNIERWKSFWKIMRDENKLLSHHLAKAIKYLENIVYPLWEPRLVLIDLTPRFFNEGHIKLHICFFGSRIAERVLYRYLISNVPYGMARLNSENFRIFEHSEWNLNLKGSDCRTSRIISNDGPPTPEKLEKTFFHLIFYLLWLSP